MNKYSKLTIPHLFGESVKYFSNNNSLAFVGEEPYTYIMLNSKVQAAINFLEQLKVKPGDRVALLSANMPQWGVNYLAVTSMGAVAVPILPDFTPEEVKNVIYHSGTKIIMISDALSNKLDAFKLPDDLTVVNIENYKIAGGAIKDAKYHDNASPEGHYEVSDDDLAAIIYTSGTTGYSKGVMLSHKNICFTAVKGKKVQQIDENDRFLSVLPISHTYENTIGFVLPIMSGSSIYYLRKPPTASVLVPALKEVKPTAILTVPLIIEKIYKNKILPGINSSFFTRVLYKLPPVRKLLNRVAGKKLLKTFGGELRFYGIGGAKLNSVVERFLSEAGFPYAIGYGLTETAPLLAGSNPQTNRLGSTGPSIEGVEIKINDPDPVTGEGEIWAKGDNVMLGYYKDPELTAEVITKDGWFRTGDLGVFDKENNLYIKGRLKSVIVGSSGENIYPEEIESVINNFKHVIESVVVEKKGKLVALVHFNHEELKEKYHHIREEITTQIESKLDELTRELYVYVNSRVNRFSKLQIIIAHPTPFQKTATQKIKRFLY